jgi:NSS family neurotransmitter:Na+ symporter
MVGMTETITHWIQEYKGFSRKKSAILLLSTIGFLSVFSVLGYNVLSEYQIAGKDINGITDFFSVQILLPLGGMLLAIFAGWCVSSESSREELGMSDGIAYKLWLFSIRYIVPFAIFLIFILGIL